MSDQKVGLRVNAPIKAPVGQAISDRIRLEVMAGDHARESVVVGLNLNQLISLLRQFSEYLLMESARAKPNAHVVLWYSDLDQRLVGHARQVGLKGGLHGSAGRCFQRNHQRVGPPASFKG